MLRLIANCTADQALAAKIAKENGLSPLVAQVLAARGLHERDAVQLFLHPDEMQLHDPMLLPDMEQAVARIREALAQGERCCVYGDYDVDGVCAATILYEYLLEQGADVRYHIPSRHSEGYGMNADAVRELHEAGVRLIITVDNGVSAQAEVLLCASLDIDVIITDHHQCPPQLPACCAVVNPARQDSAYPFGALCGAGVALKLVEALGGRTRALEALPYAALATVADVVPLVGENRVIAALGMRQIRRKPGLEALLAVAGSAEKEIDSEVLAFRLAPRLNAAGRMGDAARAMQLLLATDSSEAMELALALNDENTLRRQEERRIMDAVHAQLEHYDLMHHNAIILKGADWNPGVIGIVASRIVEEYHMPALLFHEKDGVLTGSGRSIPGINLYNCLHACAAHAIKYGGHAQAAGLTLALSSFPAFCEAMQAYLAQSVSPGVYAPAAQYEIEASLKDISSGVAQQLQQLAPFGEGNPQPVFCSKGVALQGVQRMGAAGAHLRANAAQGTWRAPLVAFGRGGQAVELSGSGELFDILYTVNLNDYQNTRHLQLMLKAVRNDTFFHQEEYVARRRENFYDAFYKNFLYNGVWNTDSTCRPCDDFSDRLIAALQGAPRGTLILCCTPDGSLRLRRMLVENGLQDALDVRFDDGVPLRGVYNVALLAPLANSARMTARRYERVFLFDALPDSPQGCWLTDSGVEVFTPADAALRASSMLRTLPVQREIMQRYYKAMAAAFRQDASPMLSSARLLQRMGDTFTREAAMLALLVFTELGFFRYDPLGDTVSVVEKAEKKQLEQSRVYAFAANMQARQYEDREGEEHGRAI